jgi:hypothetical protein
MFGPLPACSIVEGGPGATALTSIAVRLLGQVIWNLVCNSGALVLLVVLHAYLAPRNSESVMLASLAAVTKH